MESSLNRHQRRLPPNHVYTHIDVTSVYLNGNVMGQHRIQRQLLRNFSFQGRQPNSREILHLKSDGYKPVARSISRVGFFDVDCSERVDKYITALENIFKEPLRRFSHEFTRPDVGREVYDFIAMHYVRSQAFRLQIDHVTDELARRSKLTHSQARSEYERLTSHQDASVFHELVDGVSRTLTHFLLCPIILTGQRSFLTSDKIMYAGTVGSESRETFVWFPLSPSTGLSVVSDGWTGQILGPAVVGRQSGLITFAKLPEAPILRCQKPSPEEGNASFVNMINGLMINGSTEMYAADRAAIDSALRTADFPTGYRYQPTCRQ